MAIVVWNGGGDSTSWNDGNNWDSSIVPTLGDTALISTGATVYVTGTPAGNAYTECDLINLSGGSQLYYGGEGDIDDGEGGTYNVFGYNVSPVVASPGSALLFGLYSGSLPGGSITLNGATCTFITGSECGESIIINSGGTLQLNGASAYVLVTVNAGGTCIATAGGVLSNVLVRGTLRIENAANLYGSATIESGGVCLVQASGNSHCSMSVETGASLTVQTGGRIAAGFVSLLGPGAIGLITGTGYVAALASLATSPGASFQFTNGARNQGTMFGSASFDKASLLSTLKGTTSLIHSPASVRYPTNFGAGAL